MKRRVEIEPNWHTVKFLLESMVNDARTSKHARSIAVEQLNDVNNYLERESK
jgi:hypothetical protein